MQIRWTFYEFYMRDQCFALRDIGAFLCHRDFWKGPMDHISNMDHSQRRQNVRNNVQMRTAGWTRRPPKTPKRTPPVCNLRPGFVQSDNYEQVESNQKLQSLISHQFVNFFLFHHPIVWSKMIQYSNLRSSARRVVDGAIEDLIILRNMGDDMEFVSQTLLIVR
jgi:hypothetical protein